MSTLLQAVLLMFPALLVWAAASDFLTRLIPNATVAALAAGFLAAAPLLGFSAQAFFLHFLCAACVLTGGFFLFNAGWIGGGDAKLFSAAALWLGWDWLAVFALATSLFGGLLALAYVILPRLSPTPATPPATIPYGVAIAAAGLYLFPEWTIWLRQSGF